MQNMDMKFHWKTADLVTLTHVHFDIGIFDVVILTISTGIRISLKKILFIYVHYQYNIHKSM